MFLPFFSPLRRWWYSRVVRPAEVSAPVIAVGNLTLGGTGKTSMVGWLADWFLRRGYKAAVLSRGYGRLSKEALGRQRGYEDDEGFIVHGQSRGRGVEESGEREQGVGSGGQNSTLQALNSELQTQGEGRVERFVGKNRAALAQGLGGYDVLILDDGMQYLRLRKDGLIVMIHAGEGFGNGRLFPFGPLREPLSALGHAQAIVLTYTDVVDPGPLLRLRARVERSAPGVPLLESVHRPWRLTSLEEYGGQGTVDSRQSTVDSRLLTVDSRQPDFLTSRLLDFPASRPVLAFSAVGSPSGFEATLKKAGIHWVGHQRFRDHYAYTWKDCAFLERRAKELGAGACLTTEKDAQRLVAYPWSMPCMVLQTRLEITKGVDVLERMLEAVVAKGGEGEE